MGGGAGVRNALRNAMQSTMRGKLCLRRRSRWVCLGEMGMANKITEDQRRQAFEMFDRNASTNEVAKKLFNKYWNPAKKLRDEYDAQKEPGNEIEPSDAETPEAWDVTLSVPVERMDKIMIRFSPQEKADAIATVLQARLNAEA
jgi:hypothetical protein